MSTISTAPRSRPGRGWRRRRSSTLGAVAALVSAGRHGVACRSASVDVFVPAPTVDVANPIGAGDALLGATLVALERGRSMEDAVADGVAYAAASVAHPVAGYADPALVNDLGAGRAAVATPVAHERRRRSEPAGADG